MSQERAWKLTILIGNECSIIAAQWKSRHKYPNRSILHKITKYRTKNLQSLNKHNWINIVRLYNFENEEGVLFLNNVYGSLKMTNQVNVIMTLERRLIDCWKWFFFLTYLVTFFSVQILYNFFCFIGSSGVPQKSNIGLLLFLFYINDIAPIN